MAKATVEVRLAYAWDCPGCKEENFVHATIHEFSAEEQEEFFEEFGEKPEPGNWMTKPEHVKCGNCGREYRALDPGEEVDEQEVDGGG